MSEVYEVSIVIPLYNEEDVFDKLTQRLENVLAQFPWRTEIVLVDDGSTDSTEKLIKSKCQAHSYYQGVILSRNFGHQFALSAGLANVRAKKAVLVMDGDLQDPPELIARFFSKLEDGYDVVYAIRKTRKASLPKRIAYSLYYRIQRSVSNFKIPLDSGDFCMMSKRVVDQLNSMGEESRYIRGMRSWVGFQQIGLEYERPGRAEGSSHYTFRKLIQLALNGIFNFSEFPIKFIIRLGLFTIVIATAYLFYNIYRKLFIGDTPIGFTAIIMTIVLFSGVQLISIGIIGEYILRIFFQVKNRPLYIIKEKIVKEADTQ
jgi:dolichol-phosphate mannosyltransferase